MTQYILHIKRMKRQAADWKKTAAKHIPEIDKGTEIDKELPKLSNEKINNPVF